MLFRSFRAEALARINHPATKGEGYLVQIETAYLIARSGGTVVELPITFTDRVRGTSKMSSRIVVEAMARVTVWGVRDRLRRTDR